jgi:3',5'-cyclic AMP phosphodiesterase CpdA
MSKNPNTDVQVTLKKNGKAVFKLQPELAVVLYPALGNPAIVRKKAVRKTPDKTVYSSSLTLLVLCQVDTLTQDTAAHHLILSKWGAMGQRDDRIAKNYRTDNHSITLSDPFPADTDLTGLGLEGKDNDDHRFGIKLSQINIFPWVLKGLGKYPYLYKITIDLKDMPTGMFNIWWVNADEYMEVRERPAWWNAIRHAKDYWNGRSGLPMPFLHELKEYGGDVKDTSGNPGKKAMNENIKAVIYHPFFVTTKKTLSFGHVTDIHLDTRMDVYGQSEASVIEVKENCPVTAEGNRRKITNSEFHVPLKNRIAQFNRIFMDICDRLIRKKADALVITGDLVDYNRGLHTVQTHRTCFTPISETWKALGSSVAGDEHYRDNRNWFLFYDKLLELYGRADAVPVFTLLGNHDYVNFGMAPWPVWGFTWNGVFDQNLTLYECALCFGEGYNGSSAFLRDVQEKSDYVEWYTVFINPFSDYVVNTGDLSLFMVDWGVASNIASAAFKGSGTLHHAEHLFRKKTDYDKEKKDNDSGVRTVTNHEPFPVRNYSIYESFIRQKDKVKILFMHATGICPRDDVSIGRIDHDLEWSDSEMKFGSFDHRRDQILGDVEKGDLHMIVAGHSHRNVVMDVDISHTKRARVLGAGETYGTVTRPAKHLVMVTSSGGPVPKYLPGGSLICGCPGEYDHGWDYESKGLNLLGSDRFYRYTGHENQGGARQDLSHLPDKDHRCPVCGRHAKDMAPKRPRRHRPGGSLITFTPPPDQTSPHTVSITSIPSELKGCAPRRAVMADEHEVFSQDMELEHIDSYRKFKDWKKEIPISIISREPFTFHGDMDLPDRVVYVTYTRGRLGSYAVRLDRADGKTPPMWETPVDGMRVVRQYIGKDFFRYFMWAARDEEDFAFVRYTFKDGPNETWDREVHMYNEMEPVTDGDKDASPQKEPDPYKRLVLNFLRKPDHEKRKKVCGY